MKLLSDQRFLAFYSGGVTVGLAVLLLSGAASKAKKTRFDVIEAQRIDIVEPDGTLRLALSSKARFPGLVVRGKEYKHERDTTGLLFFNDEGTENGGLVFGGKKGPDGKVSSGGSLTFDQYDQDQVVQLTHQESDGKREAGLIVNDRPDRPMDIEAYQRFLALPEGPEKAAAEKKLAEQGFDAKNRILVAKLKDRSVAVELKDAEGRKRLVLRVAPDGEPSMVFLDADGKELDRFPRAKGG
ncbi:MAG: hypothetical protein HYV15_01590 [Elusimicrobia bacterium]|nr:hypothetical protein [Elusimicrobiota bacterium]